MRPTLANSRTNPYGATRFVLITVARYATAASRNSYIASKVPTIM